ncbi:PTS glucitol/sorbitol transporter subunit IIA [Selenomonas sp. TAMA-11512]|uniref:PTS glucitol/sorbitol transporter subunit IIA n=1 Tax=Selenomonas sp. TAMA-11512 TaxID=3095337 RepID=UPI003085356F|nr:PTS glucitol/sorbitol transporter subunit IIA [Selenomonas sp. TAMA-11512]
MKFSAKITAIGELAGSFLTEPEMKSIVLFNDNAPAELAEISVLHTRSEVYLAPAVGDQLVIGEKVFDITAVGDEAVKTLKELGHCTIVFKGGDTPERPGCIMVQGEAALAEADLTVGNVIEIY